MIVIRCWDCDVAGPRWQTPMEPFFSMFAYELHRKTHHASQTPNPQTGNGGTK